MNLSAWVKSNDYNGYYNRQSWHRFLRFDVPGLAPIAMIFTEASGNVEHIGWLVAGVQEGWIDDDGIQYVEPYFDFGNNCSIRDKKEFDLNFVLYEAQKSADKMEDEKTKKAERIARYEKRLADNEASERAEKDADMALFNALKGDAVAMSLLQAFIVIRDERSYFEAVLASVAGK